MVSTRSKLTPSASRRTRSQTAGAPPALESTPTKRKSTSSGKNRSPQRGQTPMPRQQPGAPNRSPMTPLRPGWNGAGPSHTGTIPKTRNPPGKPPRPPARNRTSNAGLRNGAGPSSSQNNARADNRNLPPTAPLSRANGNTSNGSVENIGRTRNVTVRNLKKQRALLKLKGMKMKIRAQRAEFRAQQERKRLEKAKKRARDQGGFWKKVGGAALGALALAGGAATRAGSFAMTTCAMNPKACELGYLQGRGAWEVRARQNRTRRALEPVYIPATVQTKNRTPMFINNGHSLITKFRRNRRGYVGNPPPRFP